MKVCLQVMHSDSGCLKTDLYFTQDCYVKEANL